MHRIFQTFIDLLSSAEDTEDFARAMATTAAALDLSFFAYLALPRLPADKPRLISTYPAKWSSHYLRSEYQRIDPVIERALQTPEPFRWGLDIQSKTSSAAQQRLLDEAAQFGIRLGFTIPIHDDCGPLAALTFAADQPRNPFETCIAEHSRVLQLMTLYFHAHVRRKLTNNRRVGAVLLSPRELECLEWAGRGKSAWEIGRILGISRHTVSSHLESAKEKLGVRTVVQAATRLAAAKGEQQN
ncbi:LuxR family transcriptional regulator [Bradyrhizobium sp. KB893862 SZCCT0404]|uniref:LuxR family transcriptional regulator n=1 Tax=Bradyrhizobium sp. KB893862 SZCCT0404 TaxID=2807672 RepID=UPI001BA65793|nr:LuxR family transcriptional regulator [Bradyrhizobium sp. KB893862 SZCCT0404]MBR1177040.1 LuxR family transcriptional regulator [Bradyrhizobium sp. KB893862 SZCCT0404]